MSFDSINALLPFRSLSAAATLALASFVSLSAQAAPVTYNLVTGSLDEVWLFDPSGGATPCPIGSANDCLVNPVSIDSASITVDFATNQILDLNIVLTGTGELDLVGLNGWETGYFTGTMFQTTSPGALGDMGGGQFHFLQLVGDVTIDSLELFAVGNPGPVPDYAGAYAAPTLGPNGDLWLTGDFLALTLKGVDIGYFPDPLTGELVLAVADFSIVAETPVPEATAATLFGVGFLIVGFALRSTAPSHSARRSTALTPWVRTPSH
jgi:hypothetical protein